jgi:hypothetical protein
MTRQSFIALSAYDVTLSAILTKETENLRSMMKGDCEIYRKKSAQATFDCIVYIIGLMILLLTHQR